MKEAGLEYLSRVLLPLFFEQLVGVELAVEEQVLLREGAVVVDELELFGDYLV